MTILFDNTPCQSTGSGLLDALNATEKNALLSCVAGNGLGLHHIEIPALKSTPITLRLAAQTTDLRTDTLKAVQKDVQENTQKIKRNPKQVTKPDVKKDSSGEQSRAQAVARLSSIVKTDRQQHQMRLEMLIPTNLG